LYAEGTDKPNAADQPDPIGFNLPQEFQQRMTITQGQSIYPPLNAATAGKSILLLL
jgi:hypothetical protein